MNYKKITSRMIGITCVSLVSQSILVKVQVKIQVKVQVKVQFKVQFKVRSRFRSIYELRYRFRCKFRGALIWYYKLTPETVNSLH